MEKDNTFIPKEYVDQMKEFDMDEYRQKFISDAVQRIKSRDQGVSEPQWWPEGEEFANCIGTATDSYFPGNPIYSNQLFASEKAKDNYATRGFQKLPKDTELKVGDIVQDLDFSHSMMVTGFDDEGKPLYDYGEGYVTYTDDPNSDEWTTQYFKNHRKRDSPIVHSGHYPNFGTTNVYRYVGTKEQNDAADRHNQEVRNFHEANKIAVKPQVTPVYVGNSRVDDIQSKTDAGLSRLRSFLDANEESIKRRKDNRNR